MDLFSQAMQDHMESEAPLATRLRTRTLDKYVVQEHILGPGKLLRRAKRCVASSEARPAVCLAMFFIAIILWGPLGTGKTTLAMVIANQTKSHIETFSAVLAGKADLR